MSCLVNFSHGDLVDFQLGLSKATHAVIAPLSAKRNRHSSTPRAARHTKSSLGLVEWAHWTEPPPPACQPLGRWWPWGPFPKRGAHVASTRPTGGWLATLLGTNLNIALSEHGVCMSRHEICVPEPVRLVHWPQLRANSEPAKALLPLWANGADPSNSGWRCEGPAAHNQGPARVEMAPELGRVSSASLGVSGS